MFICRMKSFLHDAQGHHRLPDVGLAAMLPGHPNLGDNDPLNFELSKWCFDTHRRFQKQVDALAAAIFHDSKPKAASTIACLRGSSAHLRWFSAAMSSTVRSVASSTSSLSMGSPPFTVASGAGRILASVPHCSAHKSAISRGSQLCRHCARHLLPARRQELCFTAPGSNLTHARAEQYTTAFQSKLRITCKACFDAF